MSFVEDVFLGGKAADAAIEGSEIAAGAQREALDYLKQTEQLPQHYREGALSQLGALYGLDGPPQAAAQAPQSAPQAFNFQRTGGGLIGDFASQVQAQANQYQQSQQQQPVGAQRAQPQGKSGFLQGLLEDPFYEMMLERGEEGILRNASATGGLRSGNTQDALYRANQDVLRGLYDEKVSGLQGLARLPSNANSIAQTTAGIGQTLGQGVIGAGQAKQDAYGQLINLGASAAGAGGFSDGQLKKDIEYIGKNNGHSWYKWTWNDLGEKLGLSGESEGVMAEKVVKYMPEAIGERDGFKTVDYNMLGVI